MATGTRDDAAQVPESDGDSDLIKCLDTPDKDRFVAENVRITKLIKNWMESPLNLPQLPIGTPMAKKMPEEQCLNDSSSVKKFQQEYELLSTCNHSYIVSVFCMCSCQPIFFVMEAGEQSLYKFLHKSEYPTVDVDLSSNTGYTMPRCLVWLRQIAEGLDYLHSKKIVHRDVKSGNVLLFKFGTICKVCDLDISRLDNQSMKTGNRGTGPYMAPEIKNERTKYSVKVDNFSFGVLMRECLTRESPEERHFELPSKSTFGLEMDKKYKFENLKKQMELLLSEDPKKRPDFKILISRLVTKDEKELPKLEPLALPRIDNEVKMENTPEVPSVPRTGLTLYYSVRNPDFHRAATSSEKDRIAEFLNSRSHQIKRKDQPQDAKAKHKFFAHDPIHEGEFCRIEHQIVCNDVAVQQGVFDYCRSNDQHIQWLKRKFQDEEGLDQLEFTVSKDNPAAPTDNEE